MLNQQLLAINRSRLSADNKHSCHLMNLIYCKINRLEVVNESQLQGTLNIKMYQNYRELPPLPRNRKPQAQTQNRFEDQGNPVKLVQTTTEKWIEQVRDYGNKTDVMNKEFSQHMEQVRRRTEQEFSMGSQNRSRSQNYVGGQKKTVQNRRRHLHLYSNRKVNNGIYSPRSINPPIQGTDALSNKPPAMKHSKIYMDQQENQQDEAAKQLVRSKKIIKTIRYVNDDNEEIEQRDEVDYRIVGKATKGQDLPRMKEVLRNKQGEQQGKQPEKQQFKGLKKRQNESIFKRLHDKAQNVYSGLNADSGGAAQAQYDESNNYQKNSQSKLPNGQGTTLGQSNNLEDQSNVLSSKRKKSPAPPPQYYQPEGQRIIDEKLEEIRKRNRLIQAQIQRRTQNIEDDPHFHLDEPVDQPSQLNFNASPIRGPQSKGITVTQQQGNQGGRLQDSNDFLDMFKGKGANQLAEIIEHQAAPASRTPLSQAPLKPASGIMVTQSSAAPTAQKRIQAPAGAQQNFQSEPGALQRLQGQGKQLGEMISRQTSQPPEVLKRLQEQGKELNQMIDKETRKQQQLPEALQRIQGQGRELSQMISRETQQQQPPEILSRLQGHGKELSEMINRATQQQKPPEVLQQLQVRGNELGAMISRETQQNQMPQVLKNVQGKPLSDLISRETARYSSQPQILQQLQGKPLSNLITQETSKYQVPPALQQLQGQPLATLINQQTSKKASQLPQVLQQVQGRPLAELINRETEQGREKMPQAISPRLKGPGAEQGNRHNAGTLGAESGEEFEDSEEESPPLYSKKAQQFKPQMNAQKVLDERMLGMLQRGPEQRETPNDQAAYRQNPVLQKFQGKGRQLQEMVNREVEEQQQRRSLEDLAGSIIDGMNMPSVIQNMSPSEMAKLPHSEFKPYGMVQPPRQPIMVGQPLPARGPAQFVSVPPGVGQPIPPPAQPRTNALMGPPNLVNPAVGQSQSMSPIRGSSTQMPQPIYYSPPADAASRPAGGSRVIEGAGMPILRNSSVLAKIPGATVVAPSAAYTVKTVTPTGPQVKVASSVMGQPLSGSRAAGGVVPPVMPGSALQQSSLPPPSMIPPPQIPPSTIAGLPPSALSQASHMQGSIHPSNVPNSQLVPGQMLGSKEVLIGFPGASQTIRTSQMGAIRTSQIDSPVPIRQEIVQTERQLLPGMGSFMQNPQVRTSRMVVQTSALQPQTVIITPTEMPPPPKKKKHWYSKCCTIF